MTEVLVGTRKGLFALEGEPGGKFEITARAFAGEPVEYAMRDRRSGRLLASVTSAFYGPKVWYWIPWTGSGSRRAGWPSKRAATTCSSGSGRSSPARPTAWSTPAATGACCSRAATVA